MKILFLLILTIAFTSISAQEQDSTNEKKQFLYLLKLTPKYYDENNFDDEAMKTIQIHFKRLQDMLEEGKLIFAGRADVENDKTFGIVVFDANTLKEAEQIANDDPAVRAGIMSVEVFPFNVALIRK